MLRDASALFGGEFLLDMLEVIHLRPDQIGDAAVPIEGFRRGMRYSNRFQAFLLEYQSENVGQSSSARMSGRAMLPRKVLAAISRGERFA